MHLCKLTIEGRNWPSVEHYYQFQKATAMGKHEVAASILAEDDLMEAMYLEGAVNTENSDWKNKAEMVMQTALEVKFAIPPMKLALQKSEKTIGEATRHELWGIGLTIGNKYAFQPKNWTGKNLLGKLLMEIKRKLP